MSEAFQDIHSMLLIQKELGLSSCNTTYWLGDFEQLISSDSQSTYLQSGGNNSTYSIGLEWDSPSKALNMSDTYQELQIGSFFPFNYHCLI